MPLGKAKVVREGEALTVLTYGTMVHVALAAVEENGIDAEVIDLRALARSTSRRSREREEDRPLPGRPRSTKTSGFGAELATLVQERASITSKRRSSA